MFQLLPEQLAWWPVAFAGVTEAGEVIENRIDLRFLILDEDGIIAFYERFSAPPGEEEAKLPASRRAAKLLMEIVRDWRGVAAANKEALPFNEENFARLLAVPNVAAAVAEAYRAARAAEPETAKGN